MAKAHIPPEVWPYIAVLRDHAREHSGVRLTYRLIGDAFGLSSTRVKQILGGWVQTKQPDGRWRIAPPRKEIDVADGQPGVDEGERG